MWKTSFRIVDKRKEHGFMVSIIYCMHFFFGIFHPVRTLRLLSGPRSIKSPMKTSCWVVSSQFWKHLFHHVCFTVNVTNNKIFFSILFPPQITIILFIITKRPWIWKKLLLKQKRIEPSPDLQSLKDMIMLLVYERPKKLPYNRCWCT